MMKRLTEWLGAANDRCAMPNSEVCRIGQRHDWEQMAINKLAEYEDLEEQGLLIKLPEGMSREDISHIMNLCETNNSFKEMVGKERQPMITWQLYNFLLNLSKKEI